MDGDDYYMKKVLIDFLFGFLVVTTVTICEFIVTLPFGEPWKPGSEFVDTAKKFLGVPYLWGGVGAGGIDCSGLTYICCRVNGVDLPRDAQPQYGCNSYFCCTYYKIHENRRFGIFWFENKF